MCARRGRWLQLYAYRAGCAWRGGECRRQAVSFESVHVPSIRPYSRVYIADCLFVPPRTLRAQSNYSIDVGGKLMTNYLKELVSFRQWYMMDQTSVIERAKEECCYVTQQWARDWEIAK